MEIYTDGSAHPNPGPGGYGAVVLDDDNNIIQLWSKECANTTNNSEEIKAILWALITYGKNKTPPKVFSDSAYAINCLTIWRYTWERNGWVKGDGKIPENLELIQTFHDFWNQGYRIELIKVHGHSGNKWNELADKLATGRMKK